MKHPLTVHALNEGTYSSQVKSPAAKGNYPRTFVQFLIQATKEAHLSNHDKVEVGDAHAVIEDAERAYQDYNIEGLKLLDEIDRHGTGLREAATLLRSPKISLSQLTAPPGVPPCQFFLAS